ncbi:hypothetical protein TRFO_35325 [Tritrichomonas foetus]|uniref:Uncharacterized protein n=1 Tax=Tritrichomonas foetus TaxID=1144522 RepID=A0A1J4JL62_9EUKA|nr:hypothetical protein TRFO_35325 [Tritrichomonas foetus]|eukprot:OHS98293.1 hypothetical protein TRFO_35325 [Tritrichomonas foetus]
MEKVIDDCYILWDTLSKKCILNLKSYTESQKITVHQKKFQYIDSILHNLTPKMNTANVDEWCVEFFDNFRKQEDKLIDHIKDANVDSNTEQSKAVENRSDQLRYYQNGNFEGFDRVVDTEHLERVYLLPNTDYLNHQMIGFLKFRKKIRNLCKKLFVRK